MAGLDDWLWVVAVADLLATLVITFVIVVGIAAGAPLITLAVRLRAAVVAYQEAS